MHAKTLYRLIDRNLDFLITNKGIECNTYQEILSLVAFVMSNNSYSDYDEEQLKAIDYLLSELITLEPYTDDIEDLIDYLDNHDISVPMSE